MPRLSAVGISGFQAGEDVNRLDHAAPIKGPAFTGQRLALYGC
ncbi:MAG: hypothetical protein SVK44_08295 [Nitrospirota bacterium]|nr:hypothetical protein [Nitrospirota bacterium]